MNISAPYGEGGILAYDPVEDKVQCHICGKWFRGLNNHVLRAHGWTADDYREEFGLNRGQSLICQGTRTILSQLNKKLGNWKHLASQTMTATELNRFLRSVRLKAGYRMRQQYNLRQSERLRQYNPMNEPEVQRRSRAKLHERWYGSPRMVALSKSSHSLMIARIRAKNLAERKWLCPCGEIFPTRTDLRCHQRDCPRDLAYRSRELTC